MRSRMLLQPHLSWRGAVFNTNYVRSVALMGTVVTIGVVVRATDSESTRIREEAVDAPLTGSSELKSVAAVLTSRAKR